ncbi:MAG: chorismate synthase [Actinomycetota bacterium]|nr:chorismate synthase [Actinomycetota bacterium]
MRFLSSGESHGKALIGIIDEYPSGLDIDFDFIENELKRRQSGYGRGKRMAIEKDKLEILSGIRNGQTLGSPISFLIYNKDWRNWEKKMSANKDIFYTENESDKILNPRPGHADFPGYVKYRFDDIRNVIERSSARETAIRVAAGSFAKILLKSFGIYIYSFVEQIGNVKIGFMDKPSKFDENLFILAEKSEVRCPDEMFSEKMKKSIDKAAKEGNTIGGKFLLFAKGVPAGLGSYCQWDRRLDAKIAYAIMSIPAIKAVEIGKGILSSETSGICFHDEIFYDKKEGFFRKTNNAGGIEGGMSNGEDILVSAYMKPIPTTTAGLRTVNIKTKKTEKSLTERSDICAVPAASIVGESMLALILADAVQDKFGKDNIFEMIENYKNYINYLKNI